MSEVVGPFTDLAVDGGPSAPFYLLRFDRRGAPESPHTEADFVRAATSGEFTDVYVFSHGWNNTFDVALRHYREFIAGYQQLRRERAVSLGSDYRPILAGLVWPSTSYVFPWERGPSFAGSADAQPEHELVRDLAEDVPDGLRSTFYELVESPRALSEVDARRLVETIVANYDEPDRDTADSPGLSVEAVLASWQVMSNDEAESPFVADDPTTFGMAQAASSAAELATAGVFDRLDPRQLLRLFSVRKMKDRAGTVGANGVGPMLERIASAGPKVDLHLTGHSFGARLLLSAVCAPESDLSVASMLLLEPAVSHLCFADVVPGRTGPGGYRPALKRVGAPILSTFSANDFPLTKVFHLALNRNSIDLGEAQIAGDEPPSIYAALGGYGPRGVPDGRSQIIEIHRPGRPYDLGPDAPDIYGVNSTGVITSHGDVNVPATWWAQLCLTTATREASIG